MEVPYTRQRLRFDLSPSTVKEIVDATKALRKGVTLEGLKAAVINSDVIEPTAFLNWIKTLSGIQTDRDFLAVSPLLNQLYRTLSSFSTKTLDFTIGILVLVDGSIEEKLRFALQLLSPEFPIVSEDALVRIFTLFLLGFSCFFAQENMLDLEMIQTSALKSVQALVEETSKLTFEHVWDWYLLCSATEAPYLKLLDMDRWLPVSPSRIDSGPKAVFSFVGLDAQMIPIDENHALGLEEILITCPLSSVPCRTVYDTFVQHTLDGVLDELTFIEALNELTTITSTNYVIEDENFMMKMKTLFRQFAGRTKSVDAYELAGGFSIFCFGSKSDKLSSGFRYFDTEEMGFLTKGQLWRFLRSVIIMILSLAPSNKAITTSIMSFVDSVASTVLDAFDEQTYTFDEFGQWYNQGGYQIVSWLELLDLKKWSFVMADFNTSLIEKAPIQPPPTTVYYSSKTNTIISQQSSDTNRLFDSVPALCLKNDIVLAFDLLIESESLPIRNLCFDNGDLMHYHQLQDATHLHLLEISQVYESFAPFLETLGSVIDKQCFNEFLSDILQKSSQLDSNVVDQTTTLEASKVLSALFFAHNRTGTGKIDATEFISGFLLLCGGSKSEKLSFGFTLFDEDQDGYLTRREMWKFLRSFLTILLALGNGADLSPDVIGNVCDAACIRIVKSIFNESQSNGMRSKITFGEFADWYSEKGYTIVPWIELLDTKKWPQVNPAIVNAVNSHTASFPSRDNAESLLSPQSPKPSSYIVFQFKVTNYDSTMLCIRLRDVAIVAAIANKLQFSALNVDALYQCLTQFAKGKCLTKSGFLRAIRTIVPTADLSSEDQEFLSYHLLRFFSLYESESNIQTNDAEEDNPSTVDTLQLLCGLSVFCSGSKSSKLGILFTLFDSHENEAISRRSLFELLRSVLVILFSFSHTDSLVQGALFAAERAAGALTSQVFCDTKSQATISLGAFADWYSHGGHAISSWLELLDLSKWPTKDATPHEKPLAYAFDMHEEGSLLHYTEKDIQTYLSMQEATQFSKLSVGIILDTIMSIARPNEGEANGALVISRSNFYACIRNLIPRQNINEDGQQLASRLLARFFNVYDRKKNGKVQAIELACGLTILGQGSKSQKLSSVFEFLVKAVNKNDSSQSQLPHGMLFLYLRSFLLALMALSETRFRSGIDNLYVEADQVVNDATTKVLSEIKMDVSLRTRNKISFEQFGEWYNAGGYETLSWIELLDVSKWHHQQAQSTAQFDFRPSDIGMPDKISDEPIVFQVKLTEPALDLSFSESNLNALRDFLTHVELHLYSPEQLVTVTKSFLKKHQAPSADLLSPTVKVGLTKSQFRSAIAKLCPIHAHCSNVFVATFTDNLFAMFAGTKDEMVDRDHHVKVPLVHLLCGLMVFSDASLFDILLQGTALLCFTAFTEQLIDEVSEHHFVPRSILLQCVENFLKVLYACSASWTHYKLPDMLSSVKVGAAKCLSGFAPGGPDEMVSIEAFVSWFDEAGSQENAWLRLVVLENWPDALTTCFTNRASTSEDN